VDSLVISTPNAYRNPQKSTEAERLGRTIGSLGPLRDALIKKGMIYSAGHREIGCTVSLFGSFMRRAMDEGER